MTRWTLRKMFASLLSLALILVVSLLAGIVPVPSAAFAQQAPATTAPPAGLEARVEAYLRKIYAWGPAFQVKVAPPVDSDVPGLYRLTITVSVSGQSDTAVMYLTKDGRHLIRGEVLDTATDPFASNRAAIHTEDRPSQGPADAKVVVVDFSDFQCPHCRELDVTLRQIMQRYPQVRFVAKSFPLEQIHAWATTAAIAAECAYRLKPEAYWQVHHAIFDRQESIKPDNAWQTLLDITASGGIDQADMRVCMVSPEAKKAVEQDVKDGTAVRIANTPTVFVNGRRLVGGDPAQLRQFIEYELSVVSPAAAPTGKP